MDDEQLAELLRVRDAGEPDARSRALMDRLALNLAGRDLSELVLARIWQSMLHLMGPILANDKEPDDE